MKTNQIATSIENTKGKGEIIMKTANTGTERKMTPEMLETMKEIVNNEAIYNEALRLKTENDELKETVEHFAGWLLEFVRLEDEDANRDDVFIENTLQEAHTNLNGQLSVDEYNLKHLEEKLAARNNSIEYLSNALISIGETVEIASIGDFDNEYVETVVEQVGSLLLVNEIEIERQNKVISAQKKLIKALEGLFEMNQKDLYALPKKPEEKPLILPSTRFDDTPDF